MAEEALSTNEPVEAWKARPSLRLGTILDDRCDSDALVNDRETYDRN